jgi:hypothetical protein
VVLIGNEAIWSTNVMSRILPKAAYCCGSRVGELASLRLIKNWFVALFNSDVRAIEIVPRTLSSGDISASFVIGALVGTCVNWLLLVNVVEFVLKPPPCNT